MSKPYPDYQLDCGWNALLPARQSQPGLRGEQQADVVIIGAGWTGLACARRWQQISPDSRVVVIDASSTRKQVLSYALSELAVDDEKIIGAVLNKKIRYIPGFIYKRA